MCVKPKVINANKVNGSASEAGTCNLFPVVALLCFLLLWGLLLVISQEVLHCDVVMT